MKIKDMHGEKGFWFFFYYHQTGTCKIYKCDNVTKGIQRIEDVDIFLI